MGGAGGGSELPFAVAYVVIRSDDGGPWLLAGSLAIPSRPIVRFGPEQATRSMVAHRAALRRVRDELAPLGSESRKYFPAIRWRIVPVAFEGDRGLDEVAEDYRGTEIILE